MIGSERLIGIIKLAPLVVFGQAAAIRAVHLNLQKNGRDGQI
jgi:hypothetical protein